MMSVREVIDRERQAMQDDLTGMSPAARRAVEAWDAQRLLRQFEEGEKEKPLPPPRSYTKPPKQPSVREEYGLTCAEAQRLTREISWPQRQRDFLDWLQEYKWRKIDGPFTMQSAIAKWREVTYVPTSVYFITNAAGDKFWSMRLQRFGALHEATPLTYKPQKLRAGHRVIHLSEVPF